MKLDTPAKRYFAVLWAILEVLIFGGIMFGWGSLVYVLKANGVYTEMCIEENIHDVIIPNNSMSTLDDQNVQYISYTENYPLSLLAKTIEENIDEVIIHNDSKTTLEEQKVEYKLYTENYPVSPAKIIEENVAAEESRNGTYWTGPCVKQDKVFNLGFSIICAMVTYGTLATGQINYKLGTRYTRIISFTGFVVGALMVAFTSRGVPWLVFPGMLLIGIAGFTIFFTNVQVAFLFVRGRSFIVAVLTGVLATSVATQQFVKIAYDNGISLRKSYIFLACFHCVTLISTYIWLPKMFFEAKKSKSYKVEVTQDDINRKIEEETEKEELTESAKLTEKGRSREVKETEVKTGLRSYTCSFSFALHVLWFCILQLRFQYYIGTLNPYISKYSKNLDEVSELTNIALYIMMGGVIVSVFSGALYDFEVHRYKKTGSDHKQKYGPAIIPLICSSFLGIVLSVVQMIEKISAVYSSFVLLTVFRGFLFSVGTAYLSARFPSTHFGILHGIMNGTGGTISLLQYALFNWTEAYEGSSQHVNIFLICLTSISLIHPIFQWRKLGKSRDNDTIPCCVN